jgi:glycosyltransferase involved in cell wall biosynthesis
MRPPAPLLRALVDRLSGCRAIRLIYPDQPLKPQQRIVIRPSRHPLTLSALQASDAGAGVRILMVSDVYFPRVNGVSTSIQAFRRGLHAAGHHTVLIAPEYPGHTVQEADLVRVPARYLPRDPEDRLMKYGALRELSVRLREQRFDVIHVQTPFVAHYAGVRWARELQLPVIETYHTYFEEYLHHYIPLLPRPFMRAVARHFTRSQCNALDALVAPCGAMATALRHYGVACPMHIVPTGMEIERFQAGDGARLRQRLNIGVRQPTLVHVGRMAHEKNIDFLLRMLQRLLVQLPDTILILAGEGPALPHIKNYAASLGLMRNLRFVGYLQRETELLDCYKAGDLFVFSSKTETQGLVLLEAMALGVPVVSTAYMGTVDIVTPERGARAAPDDEVGFANVVLQLLRDPQRRATMSAEAIEYAATWSSAAMVARLVGAYESILRRRWVVARDIAVSM